jgi:hypothetical protein
MVIGNGAFVGTALVAPFTVGTAPSNEAPARFAQIGAGPITCTCDPSNGSFGPPEDASSI